MSRSLKKFAADMPLDIKAPMQGKPNAPLLDWMVDLLTWLEKRPLTTMTWDQGTWRGAYSDGRCHTAFCAAGWIMELHPDAQWLFTSKELAKGTPPSISSALVYVRRDSRAGELITACWGNSRSLSNTVVWVDQYLSGEVGDDAEPSSRLGGLAINDVWIIGAGDLAGMLVNGSGDNNILFASANSLKQIKRHVHEMKASV